MRTVHNNHARFVETYFKPCPGYYFSGDGCRRDSDGDYWITGRVDDVINVSGHRLSTAEIESALVAHPSVSEAAVVGCEHPIKGQAIYAFVSLMRDKNPTEELRQELILHVRDTIGALAKPEAIQFTPDLPKTRSGKIMRRILRKIADQQPEDIGDTSTLANPDVVSSLIRERVAS
jgi:acetyl-CoA synthetase